MPGGTVLRELVEGLIRSGAKSLSDDAFTELIDNGASRAFAQNLRNSIPKMSGEARELFLKNLDDVMKVSASRNADEIASTVRGAGEIMTVVPLRTGLDNTVELFGNGAGKTGRAGSAAGDAAQGTRTAAQEAAENAFRQLQEAHNAIMGTRISKLNLDELEEFEVLIRQQQLQMAKLKDFADTAGGSANRTLGEIESQTAVRLARVEEVAAALRQAENTVNVAAAVPKSIDDIEKVARNSIPDLAKMGEEAIAPLAKVEQDAIEALTREADNFRTANPNWASDPDHVAYLASIDRAADIHRSNLASYDAATALARNGGGVPNPAPVVDDAIEKVARNSIPDLAKMGEEAIAPLAKVEQDAIEALTREADNFRTANPNWASDPDHVAYLASIDRAADIHRSNLASYDAATALARNGGGVPNPAPVVDDALEEGAEGAARTGDEAEPTFGGERAADDPTGGGARAADDVPTGGGRSDLDQAIFDGREVRIPDGVTPDYVTIRNLVTEQLTTITAKGEIRAGNRLFNIFDDARNASRELIEATCARHGVDLDPSDLARLDDHLDGIWAAKGQRAIDEGLEVRIPDGSGISFLSIRNLATEAFTDIAADGTVTVGGRMLGNYSQAKAAYSEALQATCKRNGVKLEPADIRMIDDHFDQIWRNKAGVVMNNFLEGVKGEIQAIGNPRHFRPTPPDEYLTFKTGFIDDRIANYRDLGNNLNIQHTGDDFRQVVAEGFQKYDGQASTGIRSAVTGHVEDGGGILKTGARDAGTLAVGTAKTAGKLTWGTIKNAGTILFTGLMGVVLVTAEKYTGAVSGTWDAGVEWVGNKFKSDETLAAEAAEEAAGGGKKTTAPAPANDARTKRLNKLKGTETAENPEAPSADARTKRLQELRDRSQGIVTPEAAPDATPQKGVTDPVQERLRQLREAREKTNNTSASIGDEHTQQGFDDDILDPKSMSPSSNTERTI